MVKDAKQSAVAARKVAGKVAIGEWDLFKIARQIRRSAWLK